MPEAQVGAPAGGYREAREGAALFAGTERALLAVSGPLRQKFLHNLLSNDVQDRAAGQGRLAALMDARGHLLAFLRVTVGQHVIWLETEAGGMAALEQRLTHYRVAAPVRFQALSTEVLAVIGPRSREALAASGAEVPALGPESHVTVGIGGHEVRVIAASDLPAPGWMLHVAADAAPAVRAVLAGNGVAALSRDAFDALRVEQGRPWYGTDVTEDNLLHETGLVREYHSPAKGCYVGQEVIARLEARGGHVNKRLVGLRLASPVATGAVVHDAEREVGRVTTAAVSPRLGPIAMAYVHRSRYEPGTPVDVGGVAGTVHGLPLDAA